MELNYLITTNCQNAPYASIEDAQNAASQAGYDSMSWEYFQETEKFNKCPPAEQFKEAVIYPQWEIQLLSKNLKQTFQMMKDSWWFASRRSRCCCRWIWA